MSNPKTILVCPLNWGIGHASRCIPVIKSLMQQGQKVIIAADGKPLSLLKIEFPELAFVVFPGYEPSYSRRIPMPVKMMLEAPQIVRGIRKENLIIRELCEKYKVDAILSDNRFGAYHPKIQSIFITHQLFIQTPQWLTFAKPIIKALNFNYIKKFDAVWVPDFSAEPSLSGKLSHAENITFPTKYIGPLSRFDSPLPITAEHEFDWLLLLSGPEPQRSLLEDQLLQMANHIKLKIGLIRGLPGITEKKFFGENIVTYNHLPQNELLSVIKRSKNILARAGYSTVMDLFALQRCATLVPTPGQTEQEYLAKHLNNHPLFTFIQQNQILHFDWSDQKSKKIVAQPNTNHLLADTITNWLKTL